MIGSPTRSSTARAPRALVASTAPASPLRSIRPAKVGVTVASSPMRSASAFAEQLSVHVNHLNRAIRDRDLNTLYVTGPGHGGPGMVANAYLDGTYTERYPGIDRTEEGLRALFRQLSFPGGIPSHASPETPGSINEGGELGYSLVHAYGAAFDNPDLLVACVIGDGEAETGPLATAWHGNKFLHPVNDGTVLPILHLNGYKIANPTVLARIPTDELLALLTAEGAA